MSDCRTPHNAPAGHDGAGRRHHGRQPQTKKQKCLVIRTSAGAVRWRVRCGATLARCAPQMRTALSTAAEIHTKSLKCAAAHAQADAVCRSRRPRVDNGRMYEWTTYQAQTHAHTANTHTHI